MTDTTERVEDAPGSVNSRSTARTSRTGRTGLATMNVAELKRLASGLGITGTTKMRKDDLLAAIGAHQGDGVSRGASTTQPTREPTGQPDRVDTAGPAAEDAPPAAQPSAAASTPPPVTDAPRSEARRAQASGTARSGDSTTHTTTDTTTTGSAATDSTATDEAATGTTSGVSSARRADAVDGVSEAAAGSGTTPTGDERDRLRFDRADRADRTDRTDRTGRSDRQGSAHQNGANTRHSAQNRAQSGPGVQTNQSTQSNKSTQGPQSNQSAQGTETSQATRGAQAAQASQASNANQAQQPFGGAQTTASADAQDGDDDGRGSRRRSRQRSRDRKRGRTPTTGSQEYEPELQINDDDVLVPVAGILDVLDNYAFVRTSGYLPGPNDVYVPLGLVKKYALRKGDAVTGSIKAPRDGEQPQNGVGTRQKFNALVRLDTINGTQPDPAHTRVDFGKLTPLYPQERLRLETEVGQLTTRVIDLVAPIGKGQRGLVVAPPRAGKTMLMQAIANAITTNNPECHLMVVLVDERPEEVTDMQRAVKGEVIASTFDRPAEDHTSVAELAIERAKRLVELGHDVVVLLDSLTKLGRAYNLSSPASGRILSGGVDSAALYPPKKFFGAARNIENGGSLTIIATALVETGSRMDEVIFEEFKGTGNMELTLSEELAARRIFPAVDVNASGTRREELLLGPEEQKIVWKLRRVLGALEAAQSIDLLLDRLKRTRTNIEFLRQVQMSSGAKLDADA